jgi:hypothetical protein
MKFVNEDTDTGEDGGSRKKVSCTGAVMGVDENSEDKANHNEKCSEADNLNVFDYFRVH